MRLTSSSSFRQAAYFALSCQAALASGCGESPPASPPGGSGGAPGSGGLASSGGAIGTGGNLTASGGQTAGNTGGVSSGGSTGTGGAAPGSGGTAGSSGGAGTGGAGTGGAANYDEVAAPLHELFVDSPCVDGTMLPLDVGEVCDQAPGLQHVEQTVVLGGDPAVEYSIILRIRGIWEPTNIVDGTMPYENEPFTVGGMVQPGAGDSAAVNYQQFYIEVAAPAQVYWLNNYEHVAHEIFKADYEATIIAQGGSEVTVIKNDGNERQIANYPQDIFDDVPPYDETPTLGQMLRLDVISVEPVE